MKINLDTLKNEIELNKKYNIKILCEKMNIEYKDDTKFRRKILTLIKENMQITEEGRGKGYKIIINKINSGFEYIDGRGKSEGSRGQNKIYAQYIDLLLHKYLITQANGKNIVNTTNNKIAEATGIVNCNYRTAIANQEKFYNTIKNEIELNNNTYCMFDTFKNVKTKIREVVKGSLDRLQKDNTISYEISTFVYVNNVSRIATPEELEIITKYEEKILCEMNITKRQKDNNYKLNREFNVKVLKKVQEETNITRIYKGYEIIILNKNIESFNEGEYITKLNNEILKFLRNKSMQEENKVSENKSFIGKWEIDRNDEEYITKCNKIIEIIVNVTYQDIKNKIIRCKNNKISTQLSAEEQDEIIYSLIDNLDVEDVDIDF
ncbi:hypothetical protein [Clostridium algidicarnis]|uniref:hypothetical protein n=1 Tax=Clostridium algidicarnis TaxID=37659 RepID=UPI000497DCCE|nr:hypothetical protein [Clostridium algidicarnis]